MRERNDFEESLAEILGSDNEVTPFQLAYLSDLTKGELASFKRAWVKTGEQRRRQIISHLAQLQSDDLCLNFTEVFLSCLEGSDEDIRRQAVMALEEEDSSIITPLIHLLREDGSEVVRAAAAIALGRFALLAATRKLSLASSEEIYSNLLTVIENETETEEVKRRCLEAIVPMDSPRVKELIEKAYHSDNVKVRACALYAMGRNCNPIWLPTIIKEKGSDEPEIRYEVAEACGELGMEEATTTLVELAGDADIHVREASVRALQQIGGPSAEQALHQLMNSPHQDVCERVKEALDKLQNFGFFDL